MYKVTVDNLPELEKRIRAISKKLDKYGLMYEFKKMDPVVEKISVYDIDPVNSIRYKVGDRITQVVPYTFWMQELKISGYTAIARIEHGALNIDGEIRNMVHPLNGADIDESWWTVDSKCDHCKSNRRRNITVIFQDSSNRNIQVGSTCLKEFTGIDANDIISLYASVGDIYLEEAYEVFRSGRSVPVEYVETNKFLACCIDRISANGYEKAVTAREAFIKTKVLQYTDMALHDANDIIGFFQTLDMNTIPSWEQTFYSDVKRAVTETYTRCNGLVAYAPIAYQKVRTILAEAERKAAEPKSAWQGELGTKISIEVKLERSIHYDTQWGICWIHLFRDADGNIYKWSTQSSLADHKVDGLITGTVKAHEEYDGQKQTALTRCKIS